MKAVLLAGGFGKRLKPLTDQRPKPMIRVLDKPIIEWQITWLRNFGIDDLVLCVGYMREQIVERIGNGKRFGVKIEYSVEDDPLGTGGALKNAKSLLDNESAFLMINGDVLTELDPNRLEIAYSHAIALVPLRSPFGVVEVDSNSKVAKFIEKPEIPEKWINAGVYHFAQEVFEYLPTNGNIEVTALPALAREGKLEAVKYQNVFWRSIDSHKDIEEAAKELQSVKMS
jgi:mannose-1-phosphate guanylyltransferase